MLVLFAQHTPTNIQVTGWPSSSCYIAYWPPLLHSKTVQAYEKLEKQLLEAQLHFRARMQKPDALSCCGPVFAINPGDMLFAAAVFASRMSQASDGSQV